MGMSAEFTLESLIEGRTEAVGSSGSVRHREVMSFGTAGADLREAYFDMGSGHGSAAEGDTNWTVIASLGYGPEQLKALLREALLETVLKEGLIDGALSSIGNEFTLPRLSLPADLVDEGWPDIAVGAVEATTIVDTGVSVVPGGATPGPDNWGAVYGEQTYGQRLSAHFGVARVVR
jgi:hypothetical protein